MYTIEMTAKKDITEKQKNNLMQAVQNSDAECRIDGAFCRISSKNAELVKLSYFLGLIMGGNSTNEIIKLQISYEKQ